MKYFLLFSLIISNSSYSVAVVDDPAKCDTCKPVLSGTAEKAIPGDVRAIAGKLVGESLENIKHLALDICDAFESGGVNIVPLMKSLILEYMAKDPEYKQYANPSKGIILKFLNRNRNHMTCGDGRNYMMASFDNRTAFDSLFYELLIGDLGDNGKFKDGEVLDINAFSYTGPDNSPETVLDYMYRIKEEPNNSSIKDEIEELIEYFEIKLEAKRYASLPGTKNA